MRFAFVVLVVPLLTGCIDSRMKDATNLLNIKTQTAKAEYSTAATPEQKDAIVQEYFNTAPAFTQVIDDYAHGRQPTVTPGTLIVPGH